MPDDVGRYGLARRDLDRGGDEKIYIVSSLPVSRSELDRLAIDYDREELQNDPGSPYRWFVVRLSDDD